MKLLLSICASLILFFSNNVFPQSGTFDFEAAINSGSPTRVQQTVSGVTVTVSASVDFEVHNPSTDFGMTVIGINGKTAINPNDMTSNILISFSSSVNIASLKVYEGTQSNSPGTMIFTPTGGSNSIVNFTPSPNNWDNSSKLVTLNWTGITAINITTPYTYYWGFDDIVMDATLPIELASFNAASNSNRVKLNWETATEVNNYGFEIERTPFSYGSDISLDKKNWTKVGFVQGHGNSNSYKQYSFIDKPGEGKEFKYRLKQIDLDGNYKYSPEIEVKLDAPKDFSVQQNYPNPFNPETKIEFTIPFDNYVRLKVFNIVGKEVATLLDEYKQAGSYTVEFNANSFSNSKASLSSGIYFYKIVSGNYSVIKKMILLK